MSKKDKVQKTQPVPKYRGRPINQWERKLDPTRVMPKEEYEKILHRQAFKESSFKEDVVTGKKKSSAGAMGLTQIMPITLEDYKNRTKAKDVNVFDPKQAVAIQKWQMDFLQKQKYINHPDNYSDKVTTAKALAAYNWGQGNLLKHLNAQKAKGVDIYSESLDWLQGLPKETSDYVSKILLNKDPMFNLSFKKNQNKYRDLYQYKNGGPVNPYLYPERDPEALKKLKKNWGKKRYLDTYPNNEGLRPINFSMDGAYPLIKLPGGDILPPDMLEDYIKPDIKQMRHGGKVHSENFTTERSTTSTRLSPQSINNYVKFESPYVNQDPSLKLAIQLFDPTGVSNYPDLYKAVKTGNSIPENIIGSIPLVGRTAKYLKYLKGNRSNLPIPYLGIKTAAINQDLKEVKGRPGEGSNVKIKTTQRFEFGGPSTSYATGEDMLGGLTSDASGAGGGKTSGGVNYAGIAQGALGAVNALTSKEDISTEQKLNVAADSVLSTVTPWYAAAKAGSDTVKGLIGDSKTDESLIAKSWLTPQHTQIFEAFDSGNTDDILTSIFNPVAYNLSAPKREEREQKKLNERAEYNRKNDPLRHLVAQETSQQGEVPIFDFVEAAKENAMMGMGGYPMKKYSTGSMVNSPFISKFADGGMTEGNLEGNELLINPLSFGMGGVPKTLTDYQNLPPHPEDGSMDPKGTVPLPEGTFVIPTKGYSKKYRDAAKTGDKILAEAIMNNTQVLKAKKEQADYAAMEKSYNKFMAKYGGLIEKMKCGGKVKKYEEGDYVFDEGYFKTGRPINTGLNFDRSVPSISSFNATPGLNMFGQQKSYMTPANIPDTGINGNPSSYLTSQRSSSNSFGAGDILPYLPTLGLGLEALLQKPFKLKPESYQVKSKLRPATITPDYSEFVKSEARGAYDLRKLGNVGNYMANRSNLSTNVLAEKTKYLKGLQEFNEGRREAADQFNIGTEATNLQTRLTIDQFNEQNRAARRNALREQFGQNLPATFYNQQQNKIMQEALVARYPDYKFNFGIFG